MFQRLAAAFLLVVSACIPLARPAAYTPPDPAAQRAAYAQSAGYPTKQSPAKLDQTIATQTAKFKPTGRKGETRLEAPEPFVFDGVSGTCYMVVMHLGEGATWGVGAEAGLEFAFRRPEIAGSGGPGVVGPGAVASVGCAEATGPITLTMAPRFGTDPMGAGPLTMQVYSRVLTREEKRNLEADTQRQIAEQREFAAREAEREAAARRRRDAELAARSASRSNSSSIGGGGGGGAASSGPVNVTIRSSCSRTVSVFYGDKPKYGSGTTSSISSNSINSHSFRDGDMFWVLDGSGNGVASVTVTQGVRSLEILGSCTDLSAR